MCGQTWTMSYECPTCGEFAIHYLKHVCRGCECHVREMTIPGEPQMGSYLETEWNPECPVHQVSAQ